LTIARVLQVDAFSARLGMGNPAGALLDADGLGEAAMQAIAHAVGFNEPAFVLPSLSRARRAGRAVSAADRAGPGGRPGRPGAGVGGAA
jgi:predicted PhzF superfamily epimerase YddE/YHI9